MGGMIATVGAVPPAWWALDTTRQHGSGVARETHALRLSAVPWLRAWFAEVVDPLIQHILSHTFPVTGRLGKIVVSRIQPGKAIALHVDAEPDQDTLHRVHVPVTTNPDARLEFPEQFRVLRARVGKAYEINSTLPHQAVNRGCTDRVHLVFDYHY